MPAANDSPDGRVSDASEQIRHDLLSPLTTISARTQLLARDIRRSPSLSENERVTMLVGVTAIETAVHTLCAVIDTMDPTSPDGPTEGMGG